MEAVINRASDDRTLWPDLMSISACGPRFVGTKSERDALEWLAFRLEQDAQAPVSRQTFPYNGWIGEPSSLRLPGGSRVAALALLRSPPTAANGLQGVVVDLGRGTEQQFAEHADRIKGRMVLVDHEYMFSAQRIRTSLKYRWAKERGASAFLLANNMPGDALISGSVGVVGADGIPAAGISSEAARIVRAHPGKDCTLTVAAKTAPAFAENISACVNPDAQKQIYVSAHVDGHDLGQGAMDNASGLAAVLLSARVLREVALERGVGLCFCVFNAEEWDMIGSRHFVETLESDTRKRIVAHLSVDAVAGSKNLTVLTSGFAKCADIVKRANGYDGIQLRTYDVLVPNSDHASFAEAGIPAMRLIGGWEEPASNLRYILTENDRVDKITEAELRHAARATVALLCAAMDG